MRKLREFARIHAMIDNALTESLNPSQLEAVTALPSHILVLAGAGSGKTRVLVHRIAYLMEHEHISPYSILAVTFTNKAAHEMRGRIETLRGVPMSGMWVGTFHGIAHRLLRTHWQEVGLPQTFQILDSDDQYRLIRRIHRGLNLDENKWPPKKSQWYINKCKEEGKRPRDILHIESDFFAETMHRIYLAYEEVCQNSGLVDFSELLLRSLELLQQNKDITEHYQQRFKYVLVDEFQDTNTIQYAWLKQLTGENSFIMAVGDDDQSIYSWRGAKVENIQRFNQDFSNVKTIRLEQNYRSSQTILDAANAVIQNNTNRLGKNLWTEDNSGEKITLYAAFNERDEAYYISSMIQDWIKNGGSPSDVAILYRSNAQSRILEERLIESQIAYRIYGGQKFFERAEIKDALAYLRLIANRKDDAAFERVVNTPTRGIGNTTLNQLRETARNKNQPLWDAAKQMISESNLSARALNALQGFLTLINSLDDEGHDHPLDEQTELVLHRSGLMALYKKDSTEKGLSRVENLEELVSATGQFKPDTEDSENLTPLANFLAHVALETGETQADTQTNCVSLMTLHAAKGLEFPVIFLTGLEEELFPHRMSIDELRGLEEERRLCYVGITRAKQKLFLSYAETRYLHGVDRFNRPSRFIAEIPEELIASVRPMTKVSRPSQYANTPTPAQPTSSWKKTTIQTGADNSLQIGQRVKHKKFGTGIITNYEGSGEHARVQVKFDRHGSKWLVASYAKLEST